VGVSLYLKLGLAAAERLEGEQGGELRGELAATTLMVLEVKVEVGLV
jgi:hypothetical protein